MTKDEALKLALKALEVATTPLAKDRQEVLRAIIAIREALAQPEYTSEADTEELLKLNELPEPLRLAAMLEKTMQWPLHGKAADCLRKMHAALEQSAQPEQEPVAWQGCDLDGMVEAFERVIEAHFFRKNPFHNPIDADAQMALRILRGFIPYMKQYTTPPQRTWVGLTDEELETMAEKYVTNCYFDTLEYARAIEAAHGIKENT